MSFNVLVIPEDCHRDHYVLAPILTRLVRAVVPKARVMMCTEPRLRGVAQALDWPRFIRGIVEDYRGQTHLFLIVVDRDGVADRRAKLDHIEACAAELLGRHDKVLLGVEAWQEAEVWILAGMADLPKDWSWQAVRAEVNPKETWFEPYARLRRLDHTASGGRKLLALEAAARYARIRQLCDEVAQLEERVRAHADKR